jgi:hypothetical protein
MTNETVKRPSKDEQYNALAEVISTKIKAKEITSSTTIDDIAIVIRRGLMSEKQKNKIEKEIVEAEKRLEMLKAMQN